MKKTIKPELPVPDPPAHLSESSQELYRALVPAQCRSIGRITLLIAALEAKDRAELARRAIVSEGMLSRTESTGALHINPLVRVEREARQQFARIWEILGLFWNGMIDGRI